MCIALTARTLEGGARRAAQTAGGPQSLRSQPLCPRGSSAPFFGFLRRDGPWRPVPHVGWWAGDILRRTGVAEVTGQTERLDLQHRLALA